MKPRIARYIVGGGIKHTFRAFRARNYRIYYVGQMVSLTGTWIQQVAMSWLVYRLTGSPFMLGLIGFTGTIPSLVLTPFTGAIVDRHSRYRILVTMQTLSMIQAFVLAALVLSGAVRIWQIICLSLVLGTINAIEIPARQSFISGLARKKDDLNNVIALNSALFNGTRLVGPSIGGMLIALAGEGICFLINALSFLAVIGALLAMTNIPRHRAASKATLSAHVKEGIAYITRSRPIRTVLIHLAIFNLLGTPCLVLLPVFARKVLGGGPHTLGFLMGAAGMGALTGALFLASRIRVRGLERVILGGSAAFGAALLTFSRSSNLTLSLVMLYALGFTMIAVTASSNTILQTIVEEDKRGRVMSFFTMAVMGATPLGNLAYGSLASVIGAPSTVTASGAAFLIGTIFFLIKRPVVHDAIRDRETRQLSPEFQGEAIIE